MNSEEHDVSSEMFASHIALAYKREHTGVSGIWIWKSEPHVFILNKAMYCKFTGVDFWKLRYICKKFPWIAKDDTCATYGCRGEGGLMRGYKIFADVLHFNMNLPDDSDCNEWGIPKSVIDLLLHGVPTINT
jgi:hypothetical protein